MQQSSNGGATPVQSLMSIIDVVGLTFEQLRGELESDRGRPLPKRTLYFWMNACGIERDSNGLYAMEDLQALRALIVWLKRPGASVHRFAQLFEEWRTQNASQQ
jgi:hypothetical protein